MKAPPLDHLVAAFYTRVSTDEQNAGNSPQTQLDRIKRWAAQHDVLLGRYRAQDGVDYPCIFQEDYTGFEYERPEFNTVRQLAERGVINAVVVLRSDRFARDEAVFVLLERFFKKHGVRLFSVEEGEFTPGVINRYVAAIQRAKAQDEADTIKKRLTDARRDYLKAGIPQSQGKAHYGYVKVGRKKETHYEIVPEQAEVVRLVFHLYTVERLASLVIAERLNAMSIPGPAGAKGVKARYKEPGSNKWAMISIRRMVTNPVYIGKLIGYKTEKVDGEDLLRDKAENVIIAVPPIIDQETWDHAQFIHAHNVQKHVTRTPHDGERVLAYLLVSLISCACGYSFGTTTDRKGARGPLRYYRCGSRTFKQPCKVRQFRAEPIEATIWAFVEQLLMDTRATIQMYRQSQAVSEQTLASARAHLQAIDELAQEYQAQREQTIKLYQKRLIDDEKLEVELAEADRYLEGFKQERVRWERLVEQRAVTDQQIVEIEHLGEQIAANLKLADLKTRRAILERLRLTGIVERRDDGELIVHVTVFTRTWTLPVRPPPEEGSPAPGTGGDDSGGGTDGNIPWQQDQTACSTKPPTR